MDVAWSLRELRKAFQMVTELQPVTGSELVPVEALAVLDEEVQLLVGILDDVRVQLHPVVHPERP